MTTEEKYKQALERAKLAIKECGNNKGRIAMIESIFPELSESEDERIRKEIHIYLDWLDGRKGYTPKGVYSIKDMIAWIEKQGQVKEFSISQHEIETCKENNDSLTSKDEEIRKWLIDWAKAVNWSEQFTITKEQVLDWLEKQGEEKPLPEGCVRKQVAEAKETLYSAPCADTINGQGITNQVSQPEVTKISEQVWSEEDEEELGIAIKYLQRAGQWDSATWIKSLKERLGGK